MLKQDAASKLQPLAASCSPACGKLLTLSTSELLSIIMQCMSRCLARNDELLGGKKQDSAYTTRFHARDAIPLSLTAYLQRLHQLTPYPLDAVVLAVVYLNRITHLKVPGSPVQFAPLLQIVPKRAILDHAAKYSQDPAPPLTSYTSHRLLLAALSVAASYTSDAYVASVRAAKVGGISVKELHELRLEFFAKIDYDCVVTPSELDDVCRELWAANPLGQAEEATMSIPKAEAAADPTAGPNPPLQPQPVPTTRTNLPWLTTPPLSEGGSSESSYFSVDTAEDMQEASAPSTKDQPRELPSQVLQNELS